MQVIGSQAVAGGDVFGTAAGDDFTGTLPAMVQLVGEFGGGDGRWVAGGDGEDEDGMAGGRLLVDLAAAGEGGVVEVGGEVEGVVHG